MKLANFIIDYSVFRSDNTLIKSGQIIVKNKLSAIAAKIALEGYMKKKHNDFGYLIISNCNTHYGVRDTLNDIFGQKIF